MYKVINSVYSHIVFYFHRFHQNLIWWYNSADVSITAILQSVKKTAWCNLINILETGCDNNVQNYTLSIEFLYALTKCTNII